MIDYHLNGTWDNGAFKLLLRAQIFLAEGLFLYFEFDVGVIMEFLYKNADKHLHGDDENDH